METIKEVKFIKISNNNNARLDFYIDMTTMKNPSLRISGLKSSYKRWVADGRPDCRTKEIYRWFELDYSFYVIGKEWCNREEAMVRRDLHYKTELLRMNPNITLVESSEESEYSEQESSPE